MANTILNTEYPDISYNVVGTHGYIFNRGTNLHFNSDMSQWALDCVGLNYNLSNCNINYSNVANIYQCFKNCRSITGTPWITSNITDMREAYRNCYNITGTPYCSELVNNMYYTYANCNHLIGQPVCGNNVTNMYSTYYGCSNITGTAICGPNVNFMDFTYAYSGISIPVCGPKVKDMAWTYEECQNIRSGAVCGELVNDFSGAYYNCHNLTGVGICGNNVQTMSNTYTNTKITSAQVGPNVRVMSGTYGNCQELLTANLSNKVYNISYCFYNCIKLGGNINWFYNTPSGNGYQVIDFELGFDRTYVDIHTYEYVNVPRLNIHVPNNSDLLRLIVNEGNAEFGLTRPDFTWQHNASNKCYYNTLPYVNLYVYYNHEIPY